MVSWSLICIILSMTVGMKDATICGLPMPSMRDGFLEVSVLSFVL